MAQDVEIVMTLDTTKYMKEGEKAKMYARDTKKEIDRSTVIKYRVDIENVKLQIKELKKLAKDPNLTKDQVIKYNVKINEKQDYVTEQSRRLKNYLTQGDSTISRLQAKFTGLGSVIKSVFSGNISGLNGFNTSLGSIASKLPVIGAMFAVFSSLWNAISSSAQTAREFEDAFTGFRKTVDGSEEDLKKIENGLIGLSKQIPLTVVELSKIAELGGQLGIPTENILEFTKIIAELGVTTNLTQEEAATAFAKIRNITQEPLENLSRMGSSVVALGNNFATTERDITEFSTRIAGAGEIAGLTTPEIFAISTAFSSVGVEAEAGGTAVQKTLLELNNAVNKGGKELNAFSAVAGKTPKEFAKLWKEDAGKGFLAFVNGLKKSGDDASLILDELGLSDIRLQRAFLSLANAGSTLSDALDLSNQSWEQNNALQIEAEKRFNTTTSQIQIQKNRWSAFGATFGQVFNMIWVPVFTGITTFFTSILPTLFDNVEIFFENMIQGGFNVVKNIGKAFGNIPGALVAGVNSGISVFEGFVNKLLGGVGGVIEKIKKIPGASSILGDFKVGSISMGRINGPKIDWTPINQGMQKFKSFKESIDTSMGDASSKVRNNIKNDIEAQASALDEVKNTLDKKNKSSGNDEKEKAKKIAQSERDIEIDAVNKSIITQDEKYRKLAEISKRYNDKIKEIEGKTNDEILRDAEDFEKKKSDLIVEAIKKAEEYREKRNEIGDKFEDVKNKAVDAISEINTSLKEMDVKQQLDLADRYVEVKKSLQSGNLDADEQIKLQRELNFLMGKTTDAERQKAIETDKLSESEKKYNDYLKERNNLLEKQAIAKAFTQNKDAFGENIKLTTDKDGNTTGQYMGADGKMVDIKDQKNLSYAQELVDNQTKLQNEYVELEKSKQDQLDLYNKTSQEIGKIWSDETAAFKNELENRKTAMKEFVNQAKEYLTMQAQLSQQAQASKANSQQATNTTNNKTVTVNNTINTPAQASLADFMTKKITAGAGY